MWACISPRATGAEREGCALGAGVPHRLEGEGRLQSTRSDQRRAPADVGPAVDDVSRLAGGQVQNGTHRRPCEELLEPPQLAATNQADELRRRYGELRQVCVGSCSRRGRSMRLEKHHRLARVAPVLPPRRLACNGARGLAVPGHDRRVRPRSEQELHHIAVAVAGARKERAGARLGPQLVYGRARVQQQLGHVHTSFLASAVQRRSARVARLVDIGPAFHEEANHVDVALQGGRAERREPAVQELLVQRGRTSRCVE